jgi:5-methyltetrahydropteroyltriglutamate--homocysteine methyltransferase
MDRLRPMGVPCRIVAWRETKHSPNVLKSMRTRTVFRADHCGSLIRPPALLNARNAYLRGKLSAAELEAVEDEAILGVLSLQREAGLKIFTDGEFRRKFWSSAISDKYFEGMEEAGADLYHYAGLKSIDYKNDPSHVVENPVVTGKLALKQGLADAEIAFLKKYAPGEFKITVPSPIQLKRSSYRPGVSDRAYANWDDYFADFVGLIAQSLRDMVAQGVTYVQLDAPFYSRFIVRERREQMKQAGRDPDKELAEVIAAENACLLAARGQGVTVATHICLGTYILGPQGALGGAGTYEVDLLARLIEELHANVFLIEYSERTAATDLLRTVPRDKVVALGVINVRNPQVESQDAIMRCVEYVAKHVPIDNLSLCPSCGFSGGSAGSFVTQDIQRKKLELLVRTAEKLWN